MERWTKASAKPRDDYQSVLCLVKSLKSADLLIYKGYWDKYNKEWHIDAPNRDVLTVLAWKENKSETRGSNQPFLCDRLSVEVNEWFKIRYYDSCVKFRILDNGLYETEPAMMSGSSQAILKAVQNPNLVKKIQDGPRWTVEDIETAKAIKKLWRSAEAIHRVSGTCLIVTHRNSEAMTHINANNFQSISVGQTYTLDEIIHPERHS